MHIIGFVMSLEAAMQTRTEQGSVAWVVSLNAIPVVAVPAWMVFGDSKMDSYTSTRQVGLEKTRPLAAKLTANLKASNAIAPREEGVLSMLEKLSSMPLTKGNQAELLIDGKATFDSIFKAIDEAENYILVQFYIVRNDGNGIALKEKLAAKAREGVMVRVLLDDIGCLDFPGSYVDELRDAGVDARFFMDFSGEANLFQLNFRNHRKLVVVDGKKAFIGGHNVGDEYLGKHPVRTPWRDSHVLLTGPVAKAAQVPFVEDWNWATGGDLLDKLDWDISEADFVGEMEALCLPSGPADPLETCALFYLAAINSAKDKAWIASPYFVPDGKIVAALQLAAMRGVDVRILIPEETDSKLVQLSSMSYLKEMSDMGIKMYRYQNGFLHQKVVLVDDDLATIGSANFDNRSFRLNFELTAVIRDKSFASEVEKMLTQDLENSRLVTDDVLEDKSYWYRLSVRASRMLSPIK